MAYDGYVVIEREGGGVGRKSAGAAALWAGGAEPCRAGAGLVSLRQARRRAEIRHAVALRDGAGAAGSELSLAREHRGDEHRDLRRLYPGRGVWHRRGAAVLLVSVARDGG